MKNTMPASGRGLRSRKGTALVLAASAMAAALATADDAMTVTTNGTEVTVNVPSRATLAEIPGSDITKLVKTGSGILEFYPATPVSYGVLEVQAGQFRFSSANALGTGDVAIGSSANLMVNSADVTIPNKVVFGQGSAMVAAFPDTADARVTLTCVGTPSDAASHYILLGRTDNTPSKVRLSLTNAASEAISRIRLQGVTDFEINGGTLKARSDAAANFVDIHDSSSGREKTCWIGYDGFTFDIPAGVTTRLGLPFAYRRGVVTNVLETLTPDNASFETLSGSYAAAWVNDTSANSQGWVGPKKSNDSTWANGVTAPDGDYMMGLRWGHQITTKNGVVVATATNDWYVTFMSACRPGYNGHTSPIQVTVDKGEASEQSFTIPAREATYTTFRQMVAGPFTLAAGTHKITLKGLQGTGTNQELFYDMVQLQRLKIWEPPTGLTTKTGQGTYAPTSLDTDSRFDVREGTLSLSGAVATNASSIAVASGATLAFGSGGEAQATIPEVSAESGAVLRLDNTQPIHVETFTVDGVKVNGAKAALRSAGLVVSGDGRISVGNGIAFTMVIR